MKKRKKLMIMIQNLRKFKMMSAKMINMLRKNALMEKMANVPKKKI